VNPSKYADGLLAVPSRNATPARVALIPVIKWCCINPECRRSNTKNNLIIIDKGSTIINMEE
jgi:hypothetical protein